MQNAFCDAALLQLREIKAGAERRIGPGEDDNINVVVLVDLGAQLLQPLPHGQRAGLELFDKSYLLDVPLVGAFQVMNILAALGLVIGRLRANAGAE